MKEAVSALEVWNLQFRQCRKLRFISQYSRSAISAHRVNDSNIISCFDVYANKYRIRDT